MAFDREMMKALEADGEKLQQISDAYNRGDVRIIIANKHIKG